MKKFIILTALGLCTCFTITACSNKNNETDIHSSEENCINYAKDWDEYVDFSIKNEWNDCISYVFYSESNNACMWAYECSYQDEIDWVINDNKRTGILNIKTDEWLLTCTDANWFKWAGIHEDIPVIDDDNKDCNDLSNEIEDYLTK